MVELVTADAVWQARDAVCWQGWVPVVVGGDIVRVMPGDEFDMATTAQLPPLGDGLVRRDQAGS